jgi:hypothetical protein
MKKVSILSFAVAVLLGLVSAQTATTATPTGPALPAYATYQGQSKVNEKFAS